MSKTPTAAPLTPEEEMIHLDPAVIKADDNSRYGLKATRIETLKASILAQGVVLEPVEVEALDPPQNGHQFRLTSGFYRHRAVEELNKEGAGLTLPAIIRQVDPTTRLRHQLAENMERENQSPMDKAVALKKLMEAGVSRIDIRQMFASAGGRKGNQVQPMSNALLNIYLNLLLLPKAIQEKVHDGRVGLEAAYLLGKAPREKLNDIVARAEADRLEAVEREERDEEKFLKQEAKLKEVEAQATQVVTDIEKAKEAAAAAAKLVDEKTRALRAVQARPYLDQPEEVKKAVVEEMKAAEVDVKGAQKAEKAAKNDYAKALQSRTRIEEAVEAAKAKLEESRKNKKKAGKKAEAPIGAAEVKKAVIKETKQGTVPLNISDIRQTVKDLTKDNVPYAKVQAIGLALAQCFNGITTTKQLIEDLAVQTGERAVPAPAVTKTPPKK